MEHDVGVGHRRLPATLAVAGGPGVRAGAARPHHEDIARVHPRDAPAPGADRVDLGLGGAIRVRADELLVRQRNDEILDETYVGAGATHVASNEVGKPEPFAEVGRSRHPPRGTRKHGGDRQPAGAVGGRDPAVRGHDEHGAPVAPLGDGRLEPGQVAVDEGPM